MRKQIERFFAKNSHNTTRNKKHGILLIVIFLLRGNLQQDRLESRVHQESRENPFQLFPGLTHLMVGTRLCIYELMVHLKRKSPLSGSKDLPCTSLLVKLHISTDYKKLKSTFQMKLQKLCSISPHYVKRPVLRKDRHPRQANPKYVRLISHQNL